MDERERSIDFGRSQPDSAYCYPDKLVEFVDALNLMGRKNDVIKDTHGNLSYYNRDTGYVYIKPSGVPYEQVTYANACVIDIETGNFAYEKEPQLKPSVDLKHHISIYKRYDYVDAICHTHSPYVVAFAIAGMHIPCLTTEQADYFGRQIFVRDYEDFNSWGDSIELFTDSKRQEWKEKAILLSSHGSITLGKSPREAVNLAIALENVAEKTFKALQLQAIINSISSLNEGGRELIEHLILKRSKDFTNKEIDKWHKRYMNEYGQF